MFRSQIDEIKTIKRLHPELPEPGQAGQMTGAKTHVSSFSQLVVDDEQLARLGALAEHHLSEDPSTCLLKLRQFGELTAQDSTASKSGRQSP
jgi:hypothetical protein